MSSGEILHSFNYFRLIYTTQRTNHNSRQESLHSLSYTSDNPGRRLTIHDSAPSWSPLSIVIFLDMTLHIRTLPPDIRQLWNKTDTRNRHPRRRQFHFFKDRCQHPTSPTKNSLNPVSRATIVNSPPSTLLLPILFFAYYPFSRMDSAETRFVPSLTDTQLVDSLECSALYRHHPPDFDASIR